MSLQVDPIGTIRRRCPRNANVSRRSRAASPIVVGVVVARGPLHIVDRQLVSRPTRRRPEWAIPSRSEPVIPVASCTRTIHAPTEHVWSVLARFDRIVDWADDVVHSEAMTDPPFGVGAARRVQVRRLTLVETVLVWDEGSALAYTIQGLPPVVDRIVNRWDLEPAGPDHTTVTTTIDITPGPRPPMRVAAAIVTRVMGRANAKMLAGLDRAATATQEITS